LRQHIGHVVQLTLAIGFRGEEAVVEQPELLRVGTDIHAVDQANAFDNPVRVARVLAAYQLDALAVALIEHRVIEEYVPPWAAHELGLYLLPELTRGKARGFEKILHIIVLQTS